VFICGTLREELPTFGSVRPVMLHQKRSSSLTYSTAALLRYTHVLPCCNWNNCLSNAMASKCYGEHQVQHQFSNYNLMNK
ncbi:hypothetical protein L9F63_024753, partial [Diploptera punctata]